MNNRDKECDAAGQENVSIVCTADNGNAVLVNASATAFSGSTEGDISNTSAASDSRNDTVSINASGTAFPTGIPEGDKSMSSISTDKGTIENVHRFSGDAEKNLKAGAFHNGENFPDVQRGRPVVEFTLSEDRWLEDLHLSKVTSKATKPLNANLIDASELTGFEKEEVERYADRKRQCLEILYLWRRKAGQRRKVKDLKELLVRSGRAGGDINRYIDLINEIVNSPP